MGLHTIIFLQNANDCCSILRPTRNECCQCRTLESPPLATGQGLPLIPRGSLGATCMDSLRSLAARTQVVAWQCPLPTWQASGCLSVAVPRAHFSARHGTKHKALKVREPRHSRRGGPRSCPFWSHIFGHIFGHLAPPTWTANLDRHIAPPIWAANLCRRLAQPTCTANLHCQLVPPNAVQAIKVF